MRLQDLTSKTVAVWGTAVEGQANLAFLKRYLPGKEILVIEDNKIPAGVDVIFKSPGISLYLPEVQAALKKGIEITSSTQFFLENHPQKCITIGVTGTKGKSTTASLLTHLLKSLNPKTVLGGNIGRPLISLWDEPADFVVAEVSSYMAADLKTPFDISVLLNLSPEHVDWHKSHDAYYRDKTHMLAVRKGQKAIVNRELEEFGFPDAIYFNDRNGFHTDGESVFDGRKELKLSEHALLGSHNLLNLCAVLSVIKALGLDVEKALKALPSFVPLPHRLQKIGKKNGITYIDDSIATTPEATMAALQAFKEHPIHLIAGGFERQQDYLELAGDILLSSVKTVIGLPATGTRLLDVLADSAVVTHQALSMKEAVAIAQKYAKSGDVVLLSPAAPSYNMYKNFEERGNDFKKCAGF